MPVRRRVKYINRVQNPSSEVTRTATTSSGSSAGLTVGTLTREGFWARYGAWSSRLVVNRNDAGAITLVAGRTNTGTLGIPVVPGEMVGMRVSGHRGNPTPWTTCRARLYWYKADGTAASTASIDGFASPDPGEDQQSDLFVAGIVPADGAFVAPALVVTALPGGVDTQYVIDSDAYLLVRGLPLTIPTGAATNNADVPPYADGDFPNARWVGTEHNSLTEVYESVFELHRPADEPLPATVSEELYARLAPYAYADDLNNFALRDYCDAVGSMFEDLDILVRDEVVDVGSRYPRLAPGWSQVVDLERVPAYLLNWLAQFVGGDYPRKVGETDEEYGLRVRPLLAAHIDWERGSVASMTRATQDTLTGTKQVYFIERQGSAWRLAVSTLSGETPNPAATLAALLKQKPAGIVLTHTVITGGNYDALLGTHADYNDVNTPATTYNAVFADPTL